ncbi:actin-like ATPase domain-containing protein [Vararia minispora EC-137]|uniref:Actin-like ATPase domain-containing protein n=1 Tax=Vararia minispora EC-137 TaxID=1314806 RepID=A0ACB8QHS5_9AGAM|nr:actin-like ATPase domain-containing protein [Vararia minispora EC-137]
MSLAFRDASVAIIETSRDSVRAVLGLHELLKTPSVAGPSAPTSRAPSRGPPSDTPKVNDYLVGAQLDDALAAGQDIVVSWPFAQGRIDDWTQAEALWKHVLFTGLGIRRALNESPVLLTVFPGLGRDAYERVTQLFFERLNVAGFSILERPAAQLYAANALSGVVVDIGLAHTDVTPVIDGVPQHTARTTVPIGTLHCERHLAPLLRANTSVAGGLASLSLDGPALDDALLALARQAWTSGLVRAPGADDPAADADDEGVTDIAAVVVAGKERAVIESGLKKRATARQTAAEQARAREIEALDLVAVPFRGAELTLGRERHRFCEPLLDALALAALGARAAGRAPAEGGLGDDPGLAIPLPHAVAHAVGLTEVEQRQDIYAGLLVTGEIASHVKGLGAALQERLAPYMLGNPELAQHNDVQPRAVRLVRVPDYFAEFRERGDGLAAFLGASIVAKVTFHDGRNFVNKTEYSERGPRAVLEMSPSLL